MRKLSQLHTLESEKLSENEQTQILETENRINILMNPNSHSNYLLLSHQMFSICNV